jgi:hypothetical protein
MRKFKVEYGYAFRQACDKYDVVEILAENKLDLLKKVRRRFSELCYDDKTLVEWIEDGDNWDREVDDKFLLELIDDIRCDSVDVGTFSLLLAEDIYFDCIELSFNDWFDKNGKFKK